MDSDRYPGEHRIYPPVRGRETRHGQRAPGYEKRAPVRLVEGPMPLQTLSDAFTGGRVPLLVKRDDLAGGTKLRAIETILSSALAAGIDAILISGFAGASLRSTAEPVQSLAGAMRCPGPAKVCSYACTTIDWTMPVLVGIFTAQTLQDAHLADIGAQRNQSMPAGAADAKIGRNAWVTPRVSDQRSAGAPDADDSAHQGESERHSGRRPVRAAKRRAHCAAISRAVSSEDAHTPAINHARSHEASCH